MIVAVANQQVLIKCYSCGTEALAKKFHLPAKDIEPSQVVTAAVYTFIAWPDAWLDDEQNGVRCPHCKRSWHDPNVDAVQGHDETTARTMWAHILDQ